MRHFRSLLKGKAPAAKGGVRTCVYYPNWNIYSSNRTPQNLSDIDQITNLFYCFFQIDPQQGLVSPSDEWCDIQKDFPCELPADRLVHGLYAKCFELKKKHRGIKTSMSIGGWSYRDSFTTGIMSHNGIQNFVESSTKLMLELGFDGIDLDWEYPSNYQEIQVYLKLIKALRQKLDLLERQFGISQGSFLLTMATPATMDKLPNWPIKEMDKYLSFWNLMTYDFAGEWSEETSYHCNLYSVPSSESSADQTVKFFLRQGVEPSKLVIGMATYGRSFTNTRGYGHPFSGVGKGPGPTDGIGEWNRTNLPIAGLKEHYDSNAGIAWCYDDKSKVFISYDNIQSCATKGEYVRDNNLGGGMWWESSGLSKKGEKGLVKAFVETAVAGIGLDLSENQIECYNSSEYLQCNGLLK